MLTQQFEQLSFNACPSQKTIFYDGWVIRLSDGVSKRANSVNPIFPPVITEFQSTSVEQKIQFCEKVYQAHNLPTVYKLSQHTYPTHLDSLLAEYGYQFVGLTSVQTLSLNNFDERFVIAKKIQNVEIDIQTDCNELWLSDFLTFNGYSADKRQGFFNILHSIALPTAFVTLTIDEQRIGCGLGVIEDGFMGLFDLAIDQSYRGKGYGRQLVYHLVSYAKENNCHTAYLQVILDNHIALNLYHSIGFKEQYQYWYRVKSLKPKGA